MPISHETGDYKTGDHPVPMLLESLTNELIVQVYNKILFKIDRLWLESFPRNK